MAGFYVCNDGKQRLLTLTTKEACQSDGLYYKEYYVARCTLGKFLDDKIFFEDSDVILVFDGVILNRRLLDTNNDWITYVKMMFLEDLPRFLNELRGTFAGAFFNKHQKKWTFFTSQTCDKMVYYYRDSNCIVVSTDYSQLVRTIKDKGVNLIFSESAAYDILTFGFMTSDNTLINGVKRIEAGHLLEWDGKTLALKQYHAFKITDDNKNISRVDAIEQIDYLFKKAVKLEYDKDLEYGYRHIACISGGLDSRLSVWAASELGYSANMVLMEFGKGDYLDETIAKRIARELEVELLIKPLDDAKFLLEVERSIVTNNGLSLYYGTAHGNSMYRVVDFSEFGLMHTGEEQLFWYPMEEDNYSDTVSGRLKGAYSKTLSNRYEIVGRQYDHLWEFWMYTRGYLGNMNSINAKNDYVHHSCAFQYEDLASFVFSLPLAFWENDSLYIEWYLRKYPDACKIPFERYRGAMINDSALIKKVHLARQLGLGGTYNAIRKKVGLKEKKGIAPNKNNMNPLDYWYQSKPKLAAALDSLAYNMIDKSRRSDSLSHFLLSDIEELYTKGTAMEKNQALTVLAAVQYFLSDMKSII